MTARIDLQARPSSYCCGFFTAGPLLLPGSPFTLAGSCALTSGLCRSIVVLLEPTVPDLAGGPFLLPGAPWMPAPEFCALGGVEFGCAFCADTAVAETRSPAATKLKIALMALPPDALPCERNAARCEAFRCRVNYLSRVPFCATAR